MAPRTRSSYHQALPLRLPFDASPIKVQGFSFGTASAFTRSLWPAPYNQDTPEAAWAFLLQLETWNEAEEEQQAFPAKSYLGDYCELWHECKRAGDVLICEKCRRMVISWAARGLELHQLGLRKTDQILCGEDLEAAAKHVWRLSFLYEGLRDRKPEWNLPEARTHQYEGEKKLKSIALANGSGCNYANGRSNSVRGDGTAIVTLEEFGTYAYPGDMMAAAKIITQPSPGARKRGRVGGFVNLISNSSYDLEWQRIKLGMDGARYAQVLALQRDRQNIDWGEFERTKTVRAV